MKTKRWLAVSLLGLAILCQVAWSQGTSIILQGLPLLPGPQVGDGEQAPRTSRTRPSLPQVDLAEDEGRDPATINRIRFDVVAEGIEEEQEATSSRVAHCLKQWGILWQQGNYQAAQDFAEKACQLDPNCTAAQQACALTRIITRLRLTKVEKACEAVCTDDGPCCHEKASCCEGSRCEGTSYRSLTKVMKLSPVCSAVLSLWRPITASVKLTSSDCCCSEASSSCAKDSCCCKTAASAPGAAKGIQGGCCSGAPAANAKPGQASARRPSIYDVVADGKGGCCKEGKCACCGNCPCKPGSKAKAVRSVQVFPQFQIGQVGPGVVMPHPPVVISGFCPLSVGPGAPPVWTTPVARPMTPGAPVVSPWENHYRVVSQVRGEGQSIFQINASNNQVQINTPHLEAHCQRMTCLGTRDRVMLEGNVRLTCKRDGQVTRIEAPRVLVDLLHGTFTVESAAGSVLPLPPGTAPVPTSSRWGVSSCPPEAGPPCGLTPATPTSTYDSRSGESR